MSKKPKVKWFSKPQEEDYAAAKSYLSLLFDEQTASNYCDSLKQAPTVEFEAKDLFRASELPLLGTNNSHVKKQRSGLIFDGETDHYQNLRSGMSGARKSGRLSHFRPEHLKGRLAGNPATG